MPLEPTWQEIISEAIESRLLELHTAIPGKVVSYDAATQTAEVTPVVQRAEPREDGGNTLTPLPSIPNVPVQWPRGGGMALCFPLRAGDHVLLVFSEAAIGHWRASGELAPPGDLRRHCLGYPVAIPGIAPEQGPIADPGAAGEAVLSGGVLRVGASSADFVALSAKVEAELQKIALAFSTFVPGSGGATFPQPYTSPGSVAAAKLKAE